MRTRHTYVVDLTEQAQALDEAKAVLEAAALDTLASVAEKLAETSRMQLEIQRSLEEMREERFLGVEGAIEVLGYKTRRSFEVLLKSRPDLPRHYFTGRGIRFSRAELLEWGREQPDYPTR
jgi:hypothetical protein